MKFVSTRGASGVSLEEALAQGIAPDGGLYVPDELPKFRAQDFPDELTLPGVAEILLKPFFARSVLRGELAAICFDTFSFEIPIRVVRLPDQRETSVLEVIHGPTAAFKDVGARFLAASLSRLPSNKSRERPLKILVATSGDTGGAVAAAFHGRPGFQVYVLFPEGRVSARQQHQLTCWGGNVFAFAVQGSFDDCQRMVKQAFANDELNARYRLSSANSINIGRLLPQSVYYVYAALCHYRQTGEPLSFVVPTGNLGNGLAAVLARALGAPVGEIVLATNANKTVPEYLATGELRPRESIATLASAMDVGNPSNLERLTYLFGGVGELRDLVRASAFDDAAIRATIRDVERVDGYAVCPHTATAIAALQLMTEAPAPLTNWAVVATAHPAKFDDVVEPLIGRDVEMPNSLAELMGRESRYETLSADAMALGAVLK